MFSRKRMCPYCLEDVQIKRTKNADRTVTFTCPQCEASIDPLYVKSYSEYPPVVLNVVGFRAHGKTVFLSALFYAFRLFKLNRYWPGFSYLPVNHGSQQLIVSNARMLQEGMLPEPTQQIFPEPTMILADGLPFVRNGKATLLIYDAAGESFEAPEELITYARFVRRSATIFFLVSIPRVRTVALRRATQQAVSQNPNNQALETAHSTSSTPPLSAGLPQHDIAAEMDQLLSTYIQGMTRMDAPTKKQHLVVIYTSADELVPDLPGDDFLPGMDEELSLRAYLAEDAIADTERRVPYFSEEEEYAARMHAISECLEHFSTHTLQAHNFVKLAKEYFHSVQFSMISALGFKPQADGRLPAAIDSKRLLDPFLWLLSYSAPGGKRRSIRRKRKELQEFTAESNR